MTYNPQNQNFKIIPVNNSKVIPVEPYYSSKPPIDLIEVANDTTKKQDPKKCHSWCVCRTLGPILFFAKITGFLPLEIKHVSHDINQCSYKLSKPWLVYSLVLTTLFCYQIGTSIDLANLTKVRSLPILLNNVTDIIYGVYVILLTVLSLYRFPAWIRTLTRVNSVLKEGILCQSARQTIFRVQCIFLTIFAMGLSVNIGLLFFLHSSSTFASDFDYNVFINNTIYTASFAFYAVFFSVISLVMGILACFEKLTISCLNYKPVHPMKGISETNNVRYILGFFSYRLCRENHPCSASLYKLNRPELIEYLRILHEEVSLVIYEFNKCFNPQFLVHSVIELTTLIVQWYAIIVYMAFTFKAPLASTINVLNCYFVVTHTLGMFLFLKNAQQLKNMVQGLNNFLLEYASRVSSLEEHQQVRLFIEKLKHHRPLTASGVFNIDLGIAGPISANILTYVLVALQFEIPKEEED